jgi:hypothetical protein
MVTTLIALELFGMAYGVFLLLARQQLRLSRTWQRQGAGFVLGSLVMVMANRATLSDSLAGIVIGVLGATYLVSVSELLLHAHRRPRLRTFRR